MSDLPLPIADPTLREALTHALDPDRKIARAIDRLVPVAGTDVVLLGGGPPGMGEHFAELGARVVEAAATASADLPDASAGLVVGCWSVCRGPDAPEIAEADRLLRPGGRLVIVHDYGRDEVARLLPPDRPEVGAWSHWKGPFLKGGFRVRVIHTRWSFASHEACRAFVTAAFGPDAPGPAGAHPFLTYNVALYHRPGAQPSGTPAPSYTGPMEARAS